MDWARGAVVLAVLALGVLPRLGVAARGAATADYLVRFAGELSDASLARRLGRSQALMVVYASVLALVVGGAGAWLAARSGPADRLVVVLAGLCVCVRAWLLPRPLGRVVLTVVGLATIAVGGVSLATAGPLGQADVAPLAAAAVAGLLLAGLQVFRRTPRPLPRRRRVLHVIEATGVMALICAGAVAAGLLDSIRLLVG